MFPQQQQQPHLSRYYRQDDNGKPTDNHQHEEETSCQIMESASITDNSGDYRALHLACVTGNVEYFKVLLDKTKVNEELCGCHSNGNIGNVDNNKKETLLTPLCCAVLCGNTEVVQLLLNDGADINRCSGPFKQTPLHFATATKGNAACLQLLLKAGACHDTVDLKGQTSLHLAAFNSDPDLVEILLRSGANPNIIDYTERTPLHAAAGADHKNSKKVTECVRHLLEDGRVDINTQDSFGYSALHLSAINANTKCVALLLRHGSDVTLKTSDGTTALSMLARKLPDVVKYLEEKLNSGVTLHNFDLVDANCEIKMDFSVLIPKGIKRSFSSRKKQSKNDDHKSEHGTTTTTAVMQEKRQWQRKETELLTCLVSTGNKKLLAHPLSEAFLLLKWRRVRKFFVASLLFQMALVALFTVFVVEVYLIRCPYKRDNSNEGNEGFTSSSYSQEPHKISKRGARPDPRAFPGLRGDDDGRFSWFRVVVPPNRRDKMPRGGGGGGYPPPPPYIPSSRPPPTPPPVSTPSYSFKLRTTPAPRFHYSFGFSNDSNFGRILPEAELATTEVPSNREELGTESDGFEERTEIFYSVTEGIEEPSTTESPTLEQPPLNDADIDNQLIQNCSLTWPLHIIWLLLVIFITVMSLQEIFQLIHSPARYVVSSENWTQWLLIASVMITAWKGTTSSSHSSSSDFQLDYWQYPAAASGILIAWGLILFQVGRFPSLGLYVEMLTKVAANFGLFIMAYACLLIAFALSFCVLFPEHPPFSSVPLSILKVFTMMVGEVDYEDLFYSEERSHDPILFPLTAHLLFGAFVLIMTIVLMNLLVGLAVNDIQGLQKGARLDRLSRQTALIARFESFIFSKKLRTVMPVSLIQLVQQNSLLSSVKEVNGSTSSLAQLSIYFRPNDPSDRSLPKDIKQAALRVVTYSSRDTKSTLNFSEVKQGNAGKVKRSLTSASQWKHHRQHEHFQNSRSNSNESNGSNKSSIDTDNSSESLQKVAYSNLTKLGRVNGARENGTEARLQFLEAKLEGIEKNIEQILNIVTRKMSD